MLTLPEDLSSVPGCDVQVDDIMQAILQLLQCLTAEHIALHEWRKNAETHFRDWDALDIGEHADPLCPGLGRNACRLLMQSGTHADKQSLLGTKRKLRAGFV